MTSEDRAVPSGIRRRAELPRQYLPLGIDVAGLRCLIIGGGRVGARKAGTLAEAGARVTVLSPALADRLAERVDAGEVAWQPGRYQPGCLRGHALVIAATDDPELNLRIGRDAEAEGVLACLVSPGRHSRVLFPATHHHGDVTVAVHSNGRDCTTSREVRDSIAELLARRDQAPARFALFGVHRSDLPDAVFRRLQSLSACDLDTTGAVLLSTCCRWEWYFAAPSPRPVIQDILSLVEKRCGVLLDAHRPAFTTRCGTAAWHHLLRVSCGLESPLLGEEEVVGQVRQALADAGGADASPAAQAFHAALLAQKGLRRDAGLNDTGQGWASAVLARLAERLGVLRDRTLLLVGCGEFSRRLAEHLLAEGARLLPFSSRSAAGVAWCRSLGIEVRPLQDVPNYLPHADGVVLSSKPSDVVAALQRGGAPVVIDLTGDRATEPGGWLSLTNIASAPLSGPDVERAMHAGRGALAHALRLSRRTAMHAPEVIRVGARGSRLSLAQVEELREFLGILLPESKLTFTAIDTPGDRDRATPLPQVVDGDFFTRDLDEALCHGAIDLAVHSAKDLPDRVPEGLRVAAVTPAFCPWEALLARDGLTLAELPPGARVGTSSVRRSEILLALRPDLCPCEVRGNVPQRIAQLDAGLYDALLLAATGLVRLNMTERITQVFSLRQFPAAPGQGSLALIVRADDPDLPDLLAPLDLGERGGLPWA